MGQTMKLTTCSTRDGSISLFEYRQDIDTIFAKYGDIDIVNIVNKVKNYGLNTAIRL